MEVGAVARRASLSGVFQGPLVGPSLAGGQVVAGLGGPQTRV